VTFNQDYMQEGHLLKKERACWRAREYQQ